MPHVETDAGGGVSVGFDRKAVIFEDDYYNSSTEYVLRRSTETILTLRANGGPYGGTLDMMTRNLSNFDLLLGSRPTGTRQLAPYEVYEAISTNSGLWASSAVHDIEVCATFTENTTGERMSVHDAATSIRIELKPEFPAYENSCENRHRCGVCEVVELFHEPVGASLSWRIPGNGINTPSQIEPGHVRLMLPVQEEYFTFGLEASCMGTIFSPMVTLVEPEGFFCPNAAWDKETKGWRKSRKNMAGWVGMWLHLYVTPRDVSFENIDVQEMECDWSYYTDYYNYLRGTDWISHTEIAGAGDWHCVNGLNYFARDHAGTCNNPPPWFEDGVLIWAIPHAWRQGTPDLQPWNNKSPLAKEFPQGYLQTFGIDTHGTVTISKHGWSVSRTTNNCVRVNGNIVYGRD